ncbi:MAG: CBS domain-containing protein [Chloroflexi bacterium]|nr:CBS domain-containing protein [Chloroflexota bacterium]
MSVVAAISSILHQKGSQVWTVSPEALVFDAIQMMADKNVGALLVIADGNLVGMISERDYTRKVVLKGKTSKQVQVREIMFSPVISVTPAHTVEDCMRLMTEHRIRHLPVLDGSQIAGVISIGDLVNWIISAQRETISHLENYISGQYPG